MTLTKILKDKYFWIITTLITLITFLHYSNLLAEWEIHVFFRKLYYIPIILSSFKYRLKGGLISSIIISLLYAPHLLIFGNRITITLINQYLEIALFLAIGCITGRLVELDYEKQKSLEKKVFEITKLQNYTTNIVDSINSGIVSIDINYNITSINKEGKNILELQDDDDLEINIVDMLNDKSFVNILNQVKIQKQQFTNMKTHVDISGEEKFLIVSVLPLLNILDKLQGFVIILQDRSREKHLEAQAVRSDRLATIGELASGIAHEIRNPMGIIKTISQTLIEDQENEELEEGLDIIVKEVDRANRVIDGILNFANPNDSDIKEVSLNKTLEEVVLIANSYVKKQDISINLNLNQEITILADKEKLMQVFINLIINSVQAMPDGGSIRINTEAKENGVNISVIDTGIGIKKSDIKKIYDPFFTTKETGVGLGLSISDRIIQDHDGYMIMDSILGQGTQVDIYLPVIREAGDRFD